MPASGADYAALMDTLSVPRPSGSAAERDTIQALQSWLVKRGLPCRLQDFTLYPYFFVSIGLWLTGVQALLAVSVWLRWGWITSLIVIPAVLGGLLDIALDLPLVTRFGRTTGQNILIEFDPPEPSRELVISAHYDSKTELFDHHIRTFFVLKLPYGILLAVLLGILAPLERYLPADWSGWIYILSVLLTIPLLFLAWGLGLDLWLGRLRRQPSQGAVDNGAACAILLGLAQHIQEGAVPLRHTRLTLALFGGEEVNMQGSRAYALGRDWSLPAAALNMEIMAQDGAYVYWEQDGTSLKLVPTSAALNQAITASIEAVTGAPAQPAGPINSDGYSFIRAKIPATTLGTYDSHLETSGFHLPSDNLGRVKLERLPEGVAILTDFIARYDQG